ncbi:MAG: tetratricopeptide repeat protein [Polyangiales bacterium]
MPLHREQRERRPPRESRPVEDAREEEVHAAPPAPPPEAPPFGPTGEAVARWLATPWAVWAALLLAAALRVAHLAFITRSPLADNPILDHQAYDAWAQRIAAGEWLGRGVFWVDPLYSYALAVIYKLVGHRLLVVRGLQVCLGVVNAWLAGGLTRKVTGSAALGAVGTFVAALCVPLIHNEVQLEKATLTATLACGALYLLLANTRRAAAWAGALAGLGALARGNLTLAIPFGALALLLAPAPDGDDEAPVKVWDMTFARESSRRAARFLLAGLAVVGVLTLRNVVVAGEFVPTTANGGQNLYIGQQRSNTYGTYAAPAFVRPDPAHEQDDFRAEAERRAGHPLSTMAVSSFWARAALDEVAADPGLALARTLKKLRLAFHQFEVPDNDDVGLSAGFSPVLRLPLFWVGQLAPFALLGAIAWWRRSREARVVALAVALYASTLVAFFVVGRFRVPMIPALIALAVAGAAWLVDRARARDLQRALPAAAGLALGLTVCLEPSAEMETLRTQSLAVAYNNLGAQLREGGDVRGAIAAYERAIAIAPASVVGAMRTLGDLYLEQRRYADAERVMRLVMVHKPGSPLGRAALVRLYEAMHRDPRHANDASVRAKLAEAYREAGRFDEARALGGNAQPEDGAAAARRLLAEARGHRAAGRWSEAIAAMKEAVRVGPYDEGTRYALGELMEQRGDPADMVRYWAAQQASDPKPQTSLYFQAVGLARQGDVTGALAKLDEVLRVDPAHEMSELRYCTLLEDRGDHAAALTHCDRAVEIFPDFRGAHEQRARVLTAMGRAAEAARATETARSSDPNTIRRFRYWGRYLVRHQRYAQAIPELERALAADPNDSEAAALMREARAHVGDASVAPAVSSPAPAPAPAPSPLPTAAAGARTLSDAARAAIASTLAEGRGSPVWITASGVDPSAVARAEELAAIFTQAGWNVRALTRSPVRARAGVFMFAADEVPQAYVDLARRALVAGGMTPTVGTGYRAFYEQRQRENPGYQGFALAPDQTYVVVVGRVE